MKNLNDNQLHYLKINSHVDTIGLFHDMLIVMYNMSVLTIVLNNYKNIYCGSIVDDNKLSLDVIKKDTIKACINAFVAKVDKDF